MSSAPRELTQADIDEWKALDDRYMALRYPSFGRQVWNNFKRLILALLVNGLILLLPLAFVLYGTWVLEKRRHPGNFIQPPSAPSRHVLSDRELDAFFVENAGKFREGKPSPTVPPLDPAIVAENEALLASVRGRKVLH